MLLSRMGSGSMIYCIHFKIHNLSSERVLYLCLWLICANSFIVVLDEFIFRRLCWYRKIIKHIYAKAVTYSTFLSIKRPYEILLLIWYFIPVKHFHWNCWSKRFESFPNAQPKRIDKVWAKTRLNVKTFTRISGTQGNLTT